MISAWCVCVHNRDGYSLFCEQGTGRQHSPREEQRGSNTVLRVLLKHMVKNG